MRLFRLSFVPVEFFETALVQELTENLRATSNLQTLSESRLYKMLNELCEEPVELTQVVVNGEAIRLATRGTTACFIFDSEICPPCASLEETRAELQARRQRHHSLISEFRKWVELLPPSESRRKRLAHWNIAPNYVFSCYYAELDDGEPDTLLSIRALSEPSLLDLDDMMSSDGNAACNLTEPPSRLGRLLNEIKNVDIADGSEIYVTWASLLCVSHSSAAGSRTLDLITALEVKLQTAWNKCFCYSRLADDILSARTGMKVELDSFYWDLARTFHDTRNVACGTSSSRANRIFSAMIETSSFKDEVARLEGKINLLTQYLERRRAHRDNRYKKTIEILIFLAALSTVLPVFFDLPLIRDRLAGVIVMLSLLGGGLFAILFRRD